LAATAQNKRKGMLQIDGQTYYLQRPITGVEIDVVKNGISAQKIASVKRGKFRMMLELNNKYQVKFSYPNFLTKAVEVDTRIKTRDSTRNWYFDFNIDMVEEIASLVNSELFANPIARIVFYNREYGFDYDDIYTDTVQNKLVRVVAVERKKLLLEQEIRGIAEDTDRILAEKARLDAMIKRRTDSIASTRILAENNTKALAQQLARQRLAKERVLQDSLLKVKQLASADSSRKAMHAEALRKKEFEEKQRVESERLRKESFATTKNNENPFMDEGQISQYPDGITEETLNQANREIKKVIVNRKNIKVVYQQITYNWGAIFYFKNRESMTKEAFELELDNLKE